MMKPSILESSLRYIFVERFQSSGWILYGTNNWPSLDPKQLANHGSGQSTAWQGP